MRETLELLELIGMLIFSGILITTLIFYIWIIFKFLKDTIMIILENEGWISTKKKDEFNRVVQKTEPGNGPEFTKRL